MNDGLTTAYRDTIIDILKQFPQVEEAVLYGSRAKGSYKSSSDIDITLKGKDINLATLSKIMLLADDTALPYKFDISIYHHIANAELLEHIDRIGMVFYRGMGYW